MRKKMVAGNWKMNMTPSGAVKLAEELKPMVKNDDVDVVFCVPAIDIVPVVNEVKDTNIKVGAENINTFAKISRLILFNYIIQFLKMPLILQNLRKNSRNFLYEIPGHI